MFFLIYINFVEIKSVAKTHFSTILLLFLPVSLNFADMKQTIFLFLSLCLLPTRASNPWKIRLQNEQEQTKLIIDLYEESITVPTMEMFGPMNGYLSGQGVYGVWSVTSFEIKDDKTALIRLSNDLGSETQQLKLTWQTDSTYLMELQDGVVVKRAVNRKLVKIEPKMELKVIQ